MNLASLVAKLDALLADPWPSAPAIRKLLLAHSALAEHEIARFMAMKVMRPGLDARLHSADPRERLAAVEMIPWLYPRAAASDALRRAVRDPDRQVRAAAFDAVRSLALTDVALPDVRFSPSRVPSLLSPGDWNPSGWLAGLPVGEPSPARPLDPKLKKAIRKLPRMETAADVASLLGLAAPLGRRMRPGSGKGSSYRAFSIAKASGGERQILAPIAPLKEAQRALLRQVLASVPVHDACHGFVAGRSVVSNARPHAGAGLILKTDLRDFFPSIHHRRVQGLFLLLGYPGPVARLLASLTTHCRALPDGKPAWPGVLPQGAPTSPAIANLVCRRLDARLQGLARSAGGAYTRYADDLTFSFLQEPSEGVGRFFWWVDQICQQEGFEERREKRRVMRPHQQQRVTGVVVNQAPAAPRKTRRLVRAMLHNCNEHGVASQTRGDEAFLSRLRGLAAFIHMVQPALGARLLREIGSLTPPGPAAS